MSYAYDVLQRALITERNQHGSSCVQFCIEMLVAEMHTANHRLNDAINKDADVSEAARELDEALRETS